jgi:prepilin-type N-terminal cleavage/methylation domain-containing protein
MRTAQHHGIGVVKLPSTAQARKGMTLVEMVVVFSVVAILVSVLLPALAQHRIKAQQTKAKGIARDNAAITPGSTYFSKPGVELCFGDEWRTIEAGKDSIQNTAICLPVFEGKGKNEGSRIEVYVTATLVDLDQATESMSRAILSSEATVQQSVSRGDFKTGNGLRGKKLSYDYTTQNGERARSVRVACYVFVNKRNKGVFINVIKAAENQSMVGELIVRDTLRLQNPSDRGKVDPPVAEGT